MFAYHEWRTSFSEVYHDFIDAYLSSYYTRVGGARNISGGGGGGLSIVGAVTMPLAGTLRYTTYQVSTTEREANQIKLKVVKIHD